MTTNWKFKRPKSIVSREVELLLSLTDVDLVCVHFDWRYSVDWWRWSAERKIFFFLFIQFHFASTENDVNFNRRPIYHNFVPHSATTIYENIYRKVCVLALTLSISAIFSTQRELYNLWVNVTAYIYETGSLALCTKVILTHEKTQTQTLSKFINWSIGCCVQPLSH